MQQSVTINSSQFYRACQHGTSISRRANVYIVNQFSITWISLDRDYIAEPSIQHHHSVCRSWPLLGTVKSCYFQIVISTSSDRSWIVFGSSSDQDLFVEQLFNQLFKLIHGCHGHFCHGHGCHGHGCHGHGCHGHGCHGHGCHGHGCHGHGCHGHRHSI